MFKHWISIIVTTFAWAGIASAQTSVPTKYNVLFLISDDLRAELGSYGGLAKTPNLDALVAKGVRFERAYCQYPLCNPSRSSLLTGHYPINTGVFGNRDNWRTAYPEWISLPRLFKDNGIPSLRTGKIFHGIASLDDPNGWTEGGANQGGVVEPEGGDATAPRAQQALQPSPPAAAAPADVSSAGPVDHNSREYLLAGSAPVPGQAPQQAHSDHWGATDDGPDGGTAGSTRQAIEYLRRYKDKQFFLACGYSKPHSPLNTSLRFFQEYDWNKIPVPVDYQPTPTLPAGFPEGSIRPNNADLFVGRHSSTPETARDMIRAYLACTTSVDFNVGQVLTELDRLGLAEKTIVVFWGDHGYQLGEKGKWSKAGSVWEQGARVPTIFYVPGLSGMGQSSPRVVESVDFYRTLADLCGLRAADDVEGRSLVPLLKDPKAVWEHPAYTIWSEDGRTLTAISVRNEKYRYAEFTAGAGGAMLLDEINDPHELKNVVDDPAYATAKAELSKLVAAYRARFTPSK